MRFQYSAKAGSGQTSAGVIDAPTIADARQQLRTQGLFTLSLSPEANGAGRLRAPRVASRRGRVRKADLLMLTSQLAIMCQSGIDLAEALHNAARQATNPALQEALGAVCRDVEDGKAASAAFERHVHIFGGAYVAAVAAGEASGTISQVFERLADLLRNEVRLRNTLASILVYPVILVGVGLTVVTAMIFFVLPQFAKVFRDLGSPAPPLTQLLLDTAQHVRDHALVIVLATAGAALALARLRSTEAVLRLWHRIVLNAALFRGATRALLTGRTFRLMGTVLQTGIPLLDAIRLCRASVQNRQYRSLFDTLERDVLNGSGMSRALAQSPFVPPGAAEMVATAERTGRLGPIMQLVGEFYEDDGEQRLRRLVKLLEPAIIVAMGAVVAGVVLAVMLPLLDISSMSH
ncbi:MAG TPA: type II secretion system F family protein [Planctomycetaceae bacterium]|nr:type II secretion system F family protein [Planctomycetaceae bacterium]